MGRQGNPSYQLQLAARTRRSSVSSNARFPTVYPIRLVKQIRAALATLRRLYACLLTAYTAYRIFFRIAGRIPSDIQR